MASRLKAESGQCVWEPCAGNGNLVDAVLLSSPSVSVRASEIDQEAADLLKLKYAGSDSVSVFQEDALEVTNSGLFGDVPEFDRVIANPPYGAYLSPDRRESLKRRFPKLYVRETYGNILFHAFSLLRRRGRLVFIIPDTFLWLHRHEHLRRTLLNHSTIEEIVLFPSKFFPGIRFGYSGLCIISLVKTPPSETHELRMVERLAGRHVLLSLARGEHDDAGCRTTSVRQRLLLSRPHADLQLAQDGDDFSVDAKERAKTTLGDIADVRTGFYSGNDRLWIRRASIRTPRSKHFRDVDAEKSHEGDAPSLSGIAGPQHFIPILRGGAARFVKPNQWFVDWSVEAVSEYRRAGDNAARFQNSQFYFQEGIGVPMVSSGRITAVLLERRLFDQGIVGIFPKDESMLNFVLGFLNTELATNLIRQINPTANNSANYLKRLPMVVPSVCEVAEANMLVTRATAEAREIGVVSDKTMVEINSFYMQLWCERSSQG